MSVAEHLLRRDDRVAKTFLPETLFAIHANIIQAQMSADSKCGDTGIYPREWLQAASNDLEKEIQREHDLYPNAFPLLGFSPDHIMRGAADDRAPLLDRWRDQLGEKNYLEFLHYWYWHSVRSRPLAFTRKIIRQLSVFYTLQCPAINFPKG